MYEAAYRAESLAAQIRDRRTAFAPGAGPGDLDFLTPEPSPAFPKSDQGKVRSEVFRECTLAGDIGASDKGEVEIVVRPDPSWEAACCQARLYRRSMSSIGPSTSRITASTPPATTQ